MRWHDFKSWEQTLIIVIAGWAIVGWFAVGLFDGKYAAFVLNAPFFGLMAVVGITGALLQVAAWILKLMGR